jgi:hypothetical protein
MGVKAFGPFRPFPEVWSLRLFVFAVYIFFTHTLFYVIEALQNRLMVE